MIKTASDVRARSFVSKFPEFKPQVARQTDRQSVMRN